MIRGLPATTITGFHYQRNTAGQVLISPTTGLPVVEGTFTVIGDRMPDWTLGTLNNIRYKNWNLSFLWDLKMGGDVFNATDMYLTLQGQSPRTADREKPRVIKGVLLDGKKFLYPDRQHDGGDSLLSADLLYTSNARRRVY